MLAHGQSEVTFVLPKLALRASKFTVEELYILDKFCKTLMQTGTDDEVIIHFFGAVVIYRLLVLPS